MIYVDTIQRYPCCMVTKEAERFGRSWCHMMTDSDDIETLHAFAKKIGLKRSWFQDNKTCPHYDLVWSKRSKALEAGAVSVSVFEMVKKCSKRFKTGRNR